MVTVSMPFELSDCATQRRFAVLVETPDRPDRLAAAFLTEGEADAMASVRRELGDVVRVLAIPADRIADALAALTE